MIERWELLQAQSLSEKHRHKQDLQQWQQLISDLQNMRAWLGHAEAELGRLRELVHSAEIDAIQQRIKKLKVSLLLVFFLLLLDHALDAFCLEPILNNCLIHRPCIILSSFEFMLCIYGAAFTSCLTFTDH